MLKKLILCTLVFLFSLGELLAQTVTVQANVLPPYQINIADYRSRPSQILIILTNSSNQALNIQLAGSITGDNGVQVQSRPGFRSPQPIRLAPMEVQSLSADAIAQLFDVNTLDFTNITAKDIERTGILPEGMYQLCIRALNYRTLEPYSADAPSGCSNIFPVQNLEPPIILKPMNEESVRPLAPQNLVFTWTTPPSAPPSTEYVFKIVELLNDGRNPNDAILSNTGINAYEETVRNNVLLYGPGYPPLVAGRNYAVQVTAKAPFNNAIFRNSGKSEVIVFTYGEPASGAASAGSDGNKNPKQLATHRIKGKLLWAFRQTEEKYARASAQFSNLVPGDNRFTGTQRLSTGGAVQQALVTHYSGHQTLAASRSVKLAQADPTLSFASITTTLNQPASLPAADEIISSAGAGTLSFKTESSAALEGSNRYPLAGVTVMIKGEKAGSTNQTLPGKSAGKYLANSNKQPVTVAKEAQYFGLRTPGSVHSMLAAPESKQLISASQLTSLQLIPVNRSLAGSNAAILATGKTDAEGNFSIDLLHPDYAGVKEFSHLIITISGNDFMNKEIRIPITDLNGKELIDLGEKILLANTYRFLPTLELEKPETGYETQPSFVVRLYRDAADLDRYPWLKEEGNVPAANKKPVLINGRSRVLVATDSLSLSAPTMMVQPKIQFGFARLFYTGNFWIEIAPAGDGFNKKTTDLSVSNINLPAAQVLAVETAYSLALKFPVVNGQVVLYAGESILSIQGAIVKVEYAEEDVAAKPSTNNAIIQASSALTASINASALAVLNGKSGVAAVSNQNAGLFSAAALTSKSSVSVPVMASGNAATLTGITSVLSAADEQLSTAALIKKYGPHTAKTDSSGKFYFGNLPQLKAGKFFKLKLITVPAAYRDMETNPANREHQVVAQKGSATTREFGITPVLAQIVGVVVDKEGIALPYARLHFKGSSTYFEAGETGVFETSFYEGKHTLVIEKEGYVSAEQLVDVKKSTGAAGSNQLTIKAELAWVANLKATPTVQKALASGQTFSPALFGNAAPITSAAFSHMLFNGFRGNESARVEKKILDLGAVGYLPRKVGKILFKIADKETGASIPGATIQLFDTTNISDANGQWQYEGFGGTATVLVTAPSGSGYVSIQSSVQVNETGAVTPVTLLMEKGVRITGKVSSGSQPIAGARMVPAGLEHLETITDAAGNYEIFLPAGAQQLRASKSGYFTKTEERTLTKGSAVVINFNLQGGGNKQISHLLGFEIELDKAVPDGTGERWTGRFINLQPASNAFSLGSAVSLAFTNVKVQFDAAGKPTPNQNQVTTDVTNIPLKLHGFLPLLFSSESGIKVIGTSSGKGTIKAALQLAANQIHGSRGFKFLPSGKLFIIPSTATNVADVELFSSQDNNAAAPSWKFAWAGSGQPEMELYGFKLALDLAGTTITENGLKFKGNINTPVLGPVASVGFKLEECAIGKDLRIQRVQIATSNLPSLDIAGWKASLESVLFNESGFKLGGAITISIPSSGSSTVTFSNLALGKDALFGGSFSFPKEGINLLNIVKLKEGAAPLRFGRVGNTNVYSLNGSSSIQFDKLITKKIDIPLFQLQTDGKFLLQSPANFSADLGFAKFLVQNLIISTVGQTPSIGIIGEFKSDLSMIKFTAGDIRFTAAPGGVTNFSVGKIGAELDLPVMKCGLELALKENGFSGTGNFGIPSTPISASINFHYYKLANGIDIGASFKSGIIIPIGVVSIEKVGGGFQYNSALKKFKIDINGATSITGLGHGIRLNPIGLTVESGPYIRGYAGLEVVNSINVANAEIVLDIPGKHFTIKISSDVSPLEGLASSKMQGLFKISFNPENPYVFLGCGMQTKMLGIFDSFGEFAVGVNVKDPYTRQDDISFFFRHLDADLSSGGTTVFSGIYVHTGMKIGDRNKKYGFDISIASAQFWYETSSEVMLMLNFGGGQYKFRIKGFMGAGAELCAVKICVGADFAACYALTGGKDQARGWYLDGKVAGYFGVKIGGCNPDCNSVSGCWPWEGLLGARVCANAFAYIRLSERQGINLSGGAGGDARMNGCN